MCYKIYINRIIKKYILYYKQKQFGQYITFLSERIFMKSLLI